MTEETGDSLLQAQWDRICGHMRPEIGEPAYQSWLKPMTVREVLDGVVRISVPTRFMKDWVAAHYAERIKVLWLSEEPQVRGVDIFIQSEYPASAKDIGDPAPIEPKTPVTSGLGPLAPVAAAFSDSQNISSPLDQRCTFNRFVVGKPNEFAYAAARRIAEAETPPFNPLFLYGGVGLGKTHLMHAIAWSIRERDPNRTVIYLSAEKFMYRFVRALREHNTVDFKEQFRSVNVLMIDDVQFMSGKESTQEEFFHTFNSLVDQGHQIVISADKSPSDLEGMEERLTSRLNCGLVADIHATTYELRLGILQSKAEQMGSEVPRKIMEFLAHKITSNVRELEGALNRVVAHSELVGREISLETTQEVLHDLLRAHDRRVTHLVRPDGRTPTIAAKI